MSISLLDIFLSIFGIFLVFWSIFGFKIRISLFFRFSVFLAGISLILFTVFPHFLRYIGQLFGLERGADLLVYFSVAFLLYSLLLLLKKDEILSQKITKITREIALFHASQKGKYSTVIVIPAYNEAGVLLQTIQDIFQFDNSLAVLVINDGSKDNTMQILEDLQKNFSGLFVLFHSQNLGQGATLETGFEYIRRGNIDCDFVVTFDADGQMNIADLPKMIDFLQKNPKIDMVLGSRFLGKKPKNMPIIRKIFLRGGIWFTRLISRISLSDTHNGFRVFRKNVLTKIKITIDGMGHASEIIDIIASEKIPFTELPVEISYTDYSLHKGQKSSNSIKIACKMLFKKFF